MTDIVIKNKCINWICLKDKCPANCCGPYRKDATKSSLSGLSDSNLPLLQKDLKNIPIRPIPKFIKKQSQNQWYIETKKDGSCPFLKNYACSIYKNRPTSCRAYPLLYSKYAGLISDTTCPGWRQGWTKISKIKSMVKNLNLLYTHHLAQAEKIFNYSQSLKVNMKKL